MTIARSTHVLRFAGILAVAAIAVSACGSTAPGAAAVIGDSRISEGALTTEVQSVLAAQGLGVDTSDAALTSKTLDRMVKSELVGLLATEAGIEITQGQIDAELQSYDVQAGGRDKVEEIFLQQGIAPSQVADVVVLNLQVAALSEALVPGGDQQAQGTALVQALSVLSQVLETRVSPRYGTWDPAALAVGSVPDDLSAPAAG